MGHPGKSEERSRTTPVAGNLGRELHQGGKVLQQEHTWRERVKRLRMRLGGFWRQATVAMASHGRNCFVPLKWKCTIRICAEWHQEIILTAV